MSDVSSPRIRPWNVIVQVLAAVFVGDILLGQLPAEVGARGWTPTAFGMVAICVAISVAVLWATLRRPRE